MAGGFFLGVSAFLARGIHVIDGGAHYRAVHETTGGVTIEREFDVEAGGQLEIQVSDADVSVSSRSGEARVIFRIDGDEVPTASAIEDFGFQIEARDGLLRIRNEGQDGHGRGWNDYDDGDVSLEVSVPEDFDVSVRTGDGDIAVASFRGEMNLHTGDGDIAVAGAQGRALNVQTGDGDVAVGQVESRTVNIRTGDGDVAVHGIEADEVQVQTGDGDMNLQDVSGALTASTGDGDVRVEINRFDGIQIRSGDGDVTVYAPAGIGADVTLRGSEFDIADAFGLTVAGFESRRVEGNLNGGGAELSIRVGDGMIRLIER